MSLTRVTSRTPQPYAGSTAGLPKDIIESRLFAPVGGSLTNQRGGSIAAQQSRDIAALGVVLTPNMLLTDAISLAADLKGAAKRVFVSEGVWDIGAAGITIAVSGLELISLSPGKTYFRRMTTPSSAMLTITGSNTAISGITFYDTVGSQDCILVEADNVKIRDCVFANVYQAVHTDMTLSGLVVEDNRVDANRSGFWCFFESAVTLSRVLGNTVTAANQTLKAAASGVASCSFVNNVHAATGAILIATNAGNVDAANVPDANTGVAYTLADNTAAAADVDATALSWPVATTYGVTLKYSLYRGATPDISTGSIDLVMNSAECLAYVDAVTTTVNPGVTFTGAVAAGVATLRYATTATGNNAVLKVSTIQVRNY